MAFSRRPNPVFSPAYAEVRAVLTAARRRADAPQRRLAAQLGKAASHVSMIERGQRRVDVLEFYRIARALGADPVALFAALAERLSTFERDKASGVRAAEQAEPLRLSSRPEGGGGAGLEVDQGPGAVQPSPVAGPPGRGAKRATKS